MNFRNRSTAIVAAVTAPVAVAIGAAIGYLFDPDRGKARRRRLADQAAARARRQGHRVTARARYQQGRLRGVAHRAVDSGAAYPVDDVDVKQEIHRALHAAGVALGDISIEVSEGIAVLRGQVATPEESVRVEDITLRVPGVEALTNYLHLPGEPAPNKVTSLNAAHHDRS